MLNVGCDEDRRRFLRSAAALGVLGLSGPAVMAATDGKAISTGGNTTLRLGSDLTINRIGFGAMRLGTRDSANGRAVLRRAVQLGVNYIDTADFYRSADGTANALIREALQPYPSNLVFATKVSTVLGPDLRAQVETTLKALGVERIGLVYLRLGTMGGPPHGESLAERFEALAKLRKEGLIQHVGLSNVDAAHLAEARTIAPVAAVQNHFNIIKRDDAAVLDACTANGIAFIPFFPLGAGRDVLNTERIAKVAKRQDATVHQIALAWLLAISPVTVAIPGTSSIAHLEENMSAPSVALTKEDLAELA